MRIAALFAGRIDDGGFMQAGHAGLLRARAELGCEIDWIEGIAPAPHALAEALRTLARRGPDLVIGHGGQNDPAAVLVAAEFPAQRFTVTQGEVLAANLNSYDVLQEQSAYLAGVVAGTASVSRVVGHISGIRVPPGLKGRAAFAAGVRAAAPDVRLHTTFCGAQDDIALAHDTAKAQIAAGADLIFTMLNAGIEGAIAACRTCGTRLIGNVRDWVAVEPQVFVGSAMADVGLGVLEAARDLHAGRWQAGVRREFGLEREDAVRLVLTPSLQSRAGEAAAVALAAIRAGRTVIPRGYDGEEFEMHTGGSR